MHLLVADEQEDWTLLATRVPRELRRQARAASVLAGITLMDFVAIALREKLERDRMALAESYWVPGSDEGDQA